MKIKAQHYISRSHEESIRRLIWGECQALPKHKEIIYVTLGMTWNVGASRSTKTIM